MVPNLTCNDEPAQRRCRQCAAGRGASEGYPGGIIPHIRRDPAKLRNTAHKTGCRSQDPVYGFPLGNFYGFFPLRNFSPTFYTGHFPKGISMDFSRLLHYRESFNNLQKRQCSRPILGNYSRSLF